MRILDIYDKYFIPNQLRMHMLRVAAIGQYICDNIIDLKLDTDKLIRVLLIHDIGNLAKISDADLNLNSQKIKMHYINLYGNDDHAISEKIATELGYSNDEIELLNSKIFIRNEETYNSNDMLLKIAAYSDQRVTPSGVVPLLDRLNEAKERYKDKPGSSMNNPRTDILIAFATKIEKQILEKCLITKEQITCEIINGYIEKLKDYDIFTD